MRLIDFRLKYVFAIAFILTTYFTSAQDSLGFIKGEIRFEDSIEVEITKICIGKDGGEDVCCAFFEKNDSVIKYKSCWLKPGRYRVYIYLKGYYYVVERGYVRVIANNIIFEDFYITKELLRTKERDGGKSQFYKD